MKKKFHFTKYFPFLLFFFIIFIGRDIEVTTFEGEPIYSTIEIIQQNDTKTTTPVKTVNCGYKANITTNTTQKSKCFMKSLKEIHEMEILENWENSVCSLEKRIEKFPLEKETVLRLMFIYWDLVIEDGCIEHKLNSCELENKFEKLFLRTKSHFENDAEYLWSVGYMISLYVISVNDKDPFYPSLGRDMMIKGKKLKEKDVIKNCDKRGQFGIYFQNFVYEIPEE